jgi:hypothetical protein
MSSAMIDSVLLDTLVPHTTTSSKCDVFSSAVTGLLNALAIAIQRAESLIVELTGLSINSILDVNDNNSQI